MKVNNNNFKIDDYPYLFKDIYQMDYTPKDIPSIKKADILLLPQKNFKNFNDYFFPEETMSFFNYLKDNALKNNTIVEICISDEKYNELELHADLVVLATVFVTAYALPVLVNLTSSYLENKFKNSYEDNQNVKIKINVEKNGESKSVDYEGPVKEFESTMKSIYENFFKEV